MESIIQEKPKTGDFTCINSQLRLINFIIYYEYIQAKRDKRTDWADRAAAFLWDNYAIERSPGTLISMFASIKNKTRNAISASYFAGDLEPKARYGKDLMYARLDVYIHEVLKNSRRYYVGLPANQLIYVSNKYNSIVACERDAKMFEFMTDLNKYVINDSRVAVEHTDIISYLETTDKKFNVFDLDLMEALTPSKIEQIANAIVRTAMDPAIVFVVSMGGRHITKKEYERLMPVLLETKLESGGWKIRGEPYSGRYKDFVMPMRVEILTLDRISLFMEKWMSVEEIDG